MPDFDQRQDNWKNSIYGYWSFCGPVALSNVLWYLDSKNSDISGFPGDGQDNYSLVQNYQISIDPIPGPYTDDHNFNNINDLTTIWDPKQGIYGGELVEKIAWYTNNDGVRIGGTNIGSTSEGIEMGLIQWLNDVELQSHYRVIKANGNNGITFENASSYVINGSGVLLNLGFYTSSGIFTGNHWVTIAGINNNELQIALSDPYYDVTNPTNDHSLHNNADFVSHDIFNVNTDSPFPQYGLWQLEDYEPDFAPNTITIVIDIIIITHNNQPEKPIINGPTSGIIGEEQDYYILSIDPDGDKLMYTIDWGDNSEETKINPVPSGEEQLISHIWTTEGDYTIRVKAKDELGAESDYATLQLSMPKSKVIIRSIHRFFEYYLYLFPFFHQLIGLL